MDRRTFVLALGTFAAGTDAFVIAAFLPRLADDLAVSEAAAGQSMTAFAAGYAVLATVLATLTARVPRRLLLTAGLGVLACGNLLAAAAPTLELLIAARLVTAAGAAAYTPGAFAVAGGLAPPARRGRALAIVIGGLTVATALGVPLGGLATRFFDWRGALLLVAALCLAALVGVRGWTPYLPGAQPVGLRLRLAPLRQPAQLRIIALTVLGMAGSYTLYTYAGPVLDHLGVTTGGPEGIGLLMGLYGVGAVVGNVVSGVGTDRVGAWWVLFGGYLLGVLALVSLAATVRIAADGTSPPTGFTGPAWIIAVGALVFCWGAATWTQSPAQNSRLIEHSTGSDAALAVALNSSAIYAGIGLGAVIGGVAIRVGSAHTVPLAAALVETAALALLLTQARRTVAPRDVDRSLGDRSVSRRCRDAS